MTRGVDTADAGVSQMTRERVEHRRTDAMPPVPAIDRYVVELGDETFKARATPVVEEPERSRLYAKMVEHMPGFAEYEQKTGRKIPAIILERAG